MAPFKKKDVVLAALVGFLVAVLIQIVIKNLELVLPINRYWLLVIFPVFAPAGLYATYRISLIWKPFVYQFGKFFVIGGLNTFLDLGVLNLLILVSNITHGIWFSVFKGISFIISVINSFIWNKFWTFQKSGSFILFFLVVSGSALINIGIASYMVNVIGAPEGISPKLWDNIAALSSLMLVLTWNFLGLKFIVFRKKTPSQPLP